MSGEWWELKKKIEDLELLLESKESEAAQLYQANSTQADRITELERQVAERDAQCAAMREALNAADEMVCERTEPNGPADTQRYEAIRLIHAALAPEAGKALLERLERAQRDRDEYQARLATASMLLRADPAEQAAIIRALKEKG